MKRNVDKEIYNMYDAFIEKVFIEKKDYLGDTNDIILTRKNLDDCNRLFVENYNDDRELDFIEKAKKQFETARPDVKRLFSHAIWLWGFSVNESKNCDLIFIENTKRPARGFANSGRYHQSNKFTEVSFCLKLFNAILDKNFDNEPEDNRINAIKAYIERICLCCAYGDEFSAGIPDYDSIKDTEIVSSYTTSASMVHILLYLSNPDNYERIVSTNHKQRIANCFESYLDEKQKSSYLDSRIKIIREKLSLTIRDPNFDFYDNAKIYSLWSLGGDEDADEFSGLKYKKNIIFYGPPGTSKTYSALKLARAFVARELLANKSLEMDEYLKNSFVCEENIYRLQLHANYSYESFIAGQTMIDGRIETVEGYFYKLCQTAASDKKQPYVLILDEINRIDLARLFGEAFSCIENRNESVDLPYMKDGKTMTLSVPDNLYIIGTMNEIDFSLERLDFALRRRFLWFKHGYSSEALADMLTEIQNETDRNVFIERATALNDMIRSTRELGEQYEIGHVFFAEVQNIAKSCSINRLYKAGKTPKEPVKILWKISICPMLEAYLDNIDVDTKKDILDRLMNIYYGK